MLLANMERTFVLKALGLPTAIRLDERGPNDFRSFSFNFDDNQRGLVTMIMGKTKVTSMVTATLIRPYVDRPSEGTVNFYVHLSSTSASDATEYEMDETRAQRLLDRTLKNSRIVDTESLCIVPGEQVWAIRIDCIIVEADGNLIDACVASSVAALTDFRRPDVTIEEDGHVIVHSAFEKHPVPLALYNTPICVSFAIIDVDKEISDHANKQVTRMIALADPVEKEEQLGGFLTIALNRHGEISSIVKSGGEPLDFHSIQNECLNIARKRAVNVLDSIQTAILGTRK